MYNMPGFQPARTKEEVDKRIEVWHAVPEETYDELQPSLNDYLGWTKKEYWEWVMTGRIPNG